MAKTLDRIAELHRAYEAARDKFYAHKRDDAPKDVDSEEYFRWSFTEDRLCTASVKAQNAYREACDEFFAKSCPDLIQLLGEIDEHFEGQVDINSNGGPNFAMRCRTEIEAFIDPAPETQAAIEKREAGRVLPFSGSS